MAIDEEMVSVDVKTCFLVESAGMYSGQVPNTNINLPHQTVLIFDCYDVMQEA